MAVDLDFNTAAASIAIPGKRYWMAPLGTLEAEVISRMQAMCGNAPDRLTWSGNPERFADGYHGPKDDSGWYIAHADHVPTVIAGYWCTGERWSLSATDDSLVRRSPESLRTETTAEEVDFSRWRIEEERRQREAARVREDADAQARARAAYAAAMPASPDHPYLARKHIQPLGWARQDINGNLLVPVFGEGTGTEVLSLQYIYEDGTKRFARGSIMAGRFGFIGSDKPDTTPVLLCEGYATACSLHMATGYLTVFSFSAGNLARVAAFLRKEWQGRRIVICADDDRWPGNNGREKPNVGLEKAEAARAAAGGNTEVARPVFHDLVTRPTDFNDLAVLEGLDAVRRIITPENTIPIITHWDVDLFLGPAPEQEWLVKDLIPAHVAGLLAAPGGAGKGMLELDLALRVAGKPMEGFDFNAEPSDLWLGHRVVGHGAAVLILAEDSLADVRRRLDVLDPDRSRLKAAIGRFYAVALPNAGGPLTFFANGQGRRGEFARTEVFLNILGQLQAIPGLALVVIDPLASFVGCDINADPQAGQFVMGSFAALAGQARAGIMVTHHMGKGNKAGRTGSSAEAIRDSVRGVSSIVDGVRYVIGLQPATGAERDRMEKKKSIRIMPGDLFYGGLVKSNAPADMTISPFLRNRRTGLLEIVMDTDVPAAKEEDDLSSLLAEGIAGAAAGNTPFTRNGRATSLYARRAELAEPLRGLSRERFLALAQELLANGRLVPVQLGAGHRLFEYLDVPGGALARLGRKEAGAWKYGDGLAGGGQKCRHQA